VSSPIKCTNIPPPPPVHILHLCLDRLCRQKGTRTRLLRPQGRLDKGEFNSASTRVLHYVLNPEAEARREHQESRVAELEAEVAVLKLQTSLGSKTREDDGGSSQPQSAALAALEAEVVVARQKVNLLPLLGRYIRPPPPSFPIPPHADFSMHGAVSLRDVGLSIPVTPPLLNLPHSLLPSL